MPTSQKLVDIVAEVSGLSKAGVATRFRVIREAGYITKGGRGRSAADRGLDSAARLLVACLASDDARTADKALFDAFLLKPCSFEQTPLEGRTNNAPYRHALTPRFFASFPTTRLADSVDLDLTVMRDRPLKKTFFEGLPTAHLSAATHFGSVLAGVFEAVRTKTLTPFPSDSDFAGGVLPADPEWRLKHRAFVSVVLSSGLVEHQWQVIGASVSFGIQGLYRETRRFASGERKAMQTSPVRQDRSFGLELIHSLVSCFEDQAKG